MTDTTAGAVLGTGLTPPCPICRAASSAAWLRRDGYQLWRCRGCGLGFVGSEPEADELPAMYGEEYFQGGGGEYADYLADEDIHRQHARRILDQIERYRKPPADLLDIGCACGFLLDEARKRGWRVTGYEVSAFASGYARNTLGLPVIEGSFVDAALSSQSVDVVVFLNVFEHLPRPRGVRHHIERILRPGGLLFIETWNRESMTARVLGGRWHQIAPRFVPYYYTHRSLTRLFRGWDERRFARLTKPIRVGRGLSIVARTAPTAMLRSALRTLATRWSGAVAPYIGDDLVAAIFERLP